MKRKNYSNEISIIEYFEVLIEITAEDVTLGRPAPYSRNPDSPLYSDPGESAEIGCVSGKFVIYKKNKDGKEEAKYFDVPQEMMNYIYNNNESYIVETIFEKALDIQSNDFDFPDDHGEYDRQNDR